MKAKGLIVFLFVLAAFSFSCATKPIQTAGGPQLLPAPLVASVQATPTPFVPAIAFVGFFPTLESIPIPATVMPTAPTAVPTVAPTEIPSPIPTLQPTAIPAPEEKEEIPSGFEKYFSKIEVGKLPSGPRPEKWWNEVIPSAIIGESEDLCATFITSREKVENVDVGIYDINNRIYFQAKAPYARSGKVERSAIGCFTRKPGIGNYEFRVWIGEDFIASLSFDVRPDNQVPVVEKPAPTVAPTRKPTAIPAPAQTAPAPPIAGSPLKTPRTGFAIPVSAMKHEAEVADDIADKVRGIYAYHLQQEEPNLIISMRMYNLQRLNITGITTQDCLTHGDYTYCYNPSSASFSPGDPVRQILLDANFDGNLRKELTERGGLDWKVTVKILSIVISP